MARIREIGEAELERFLDVVAQAMPREDMGGVAGLVDWRRQAADMIWLLAEEDGDAVGAGYGVTGWHTPPHRGIGAGLVVPGRRGHGTGDELCRRRALGGRARRRRARGAGGGGGRRCGWCST